MRYLNSKKSIHFLGDFEKISWQEKVLGAFGTAETMGDQ